MYGCMSKFVGVSCVALALVGSGAWIVAAEGKTYGRPLTAQDTIPIAELLENPDPYLGKIVRVQGLVTGVCEKRGCWMTLAGEGDFEEIRIKVDDGVIVFPLEAKGRRAVAEGTFTKVDMTLEQTVAYRQHHAEVHGEEFDPASVTEPMSFYQIQGTGAVIH